MRWKRRVLKRQQRRRRLMMDKRKGDIEDDEIERIATEMCGHVPPSLHPYTKRAAELYEKMKTAVVCCFDLFDHSLHLRFVVNPAFHDKVMAWVLREKKKKKENKSYSYQYRDLLIPSASGLYRWIQFAVVFDKSKTCCVKNVLNVISDMARTLPDAQIMGYKVGGRRYNGGYTPTIPLYVERWNYVFKMDDKLRKMILFKEKEDKSVLDGGYNMWCYCNRNKMMMSCRRRLAIGEILHEDVMIMMDEWIIDQEQAWKRLDSDQQLMAVAHLSLLMDMTPPHIISDLYSRKEKERETPE